MGREPIKIEDYEDYEIFKYSPSLFHLFGKYYPEKITLRRIIRFLLALPDGYGIYSLVKEGKALGYCTIQNGKSPRFDYTSEKDIVVGPYVIMPEYQGNGLAAKLIYRVLLTNKGKYEYAYAYIKKDNIASIKTCEKLGFSFYKNAHVTSIKADVKSTDDADASHIIMRIREGEAR